MLGTLGVLVVALALGTGCGQAADQSSDLEAQRQENEELQQALQDMQEEQEEAEEQEAAEKQEELEQENEELQEQNEALQEQAQEQQTQPEQAGPTETESDSPDVIIESNEDWTASPSEAPEGVVVVSPDYDVGAITTEEAEVINAAIAYYQAAEIGDYATTHDLLSVADQSFYPLDEWVASNTSLDSAAGEFVVTDAYPDDVGNGYPTYAVLVTVYLADGTSFDRTTYFTNEGNGYWAHWLSDEEMDMFSGAI